MRNNLIQAFGLSGGGSEKGINIFLVVKKSLKRRKKPEPGTRSSSSCISVQTLTALFGSSTLIQAANK